MSKPALSTLKDVVDRAAKAAGVPPASLPALDAWGQCPPLDRIDGAALAGLTALTRLSLSTNAIDRIAGVGGLPALRVLSLGRNALRRLDGVEAATGLEELWVSYNQLGKLVRERASGGEGMGLRRARGRARRHNVTNSPPPPPRQAGAEKLPNLRVLLASNNAITAWAEVERLAASTGLTSLLLAGNPLATEYRDRGDGAGFRVEVLRRLPRLVALDGVTVGEEERKAAVAAGAVGAAGAAA